MNIGQLKEIVELVSTKGLIESFVIEPDGRVTAVEPANTFMCHLEYDGIELSEQLTVDQSGTFQKVISRFPDDATVDVTENFIEINSETRHAKLPKFDPKVIREAPKVSNIDFDVTLEDVPLENLLNGVKNVTGNIMEYYVFEAKDDKLTLTVGHQDEGGSITEDICPVYIDGEARVTFAGHVPECIKTLKVNPTIYMKTDWPMKIECETDDYKVYYLLAPYVESQ